MNKVKLAFIGCGNIVKGHLAQGLKDFPDVAFVGWCDPNQENAAARRDEAGGNGALYTDAEKMIDTEKPDAVFIMLPPQAHGEIDHMVIDRGLPFFTEKPVAMDLELARALLKKIRKNKTLAAVGYMNRYRRSVQRVKELLGQMNPVFLHGGWVGPGPKPESPLFKWWTRKEISGGQFVEQTTHTTDLSIYLFGEAESVYAVPITKRLKRPKGFNIEDASMVQIAFKNGAAANLYSSCCTACGSGVTLNVFGTAMKAEFTGWGHDVTIALPGDEVITIPGAAPHPFGLEDRAFVDAVKSGDDSGIIATYEDGVKALAIGLAANESMETGAVVKLPVI